MTTVYDIFGSSFIAGVVLLVVLQLNLFMSNSSSVSDNELRIQQNAKTLAEIINNDFRKIGYQFDGTAILIAEEKKIKFLGDLHRPGDSGYGVIDTVEYSILDSSFAENTSNPRDIVLVRNLNGTDVISGPTLGLVDLKFTYLDSVSTPTNVLSEIRYIKTELWIEPTEIINDKITGKEENFFTYWEFTIHPRNI